MPVCGDAQGSLKPLLTLTAREDNLKMNAALSDYLGGSSKSRRRQ